MAEATTSAPAAAAPAGGRKCPQMGRPSANLRMGIVGLPNVGKSTLFNNLTQLQVPAANFPFCTIEPNEARVAIPDERFDYLCSKYKPASKVQAYLQITDIAGLVRGASKGEGLGNAFLSHIRAVDGIFHVIRVFENEEVTHVDGSIDPVRDLDVITEELLLKDEETIRNKLDASERANRGSKKNKQALEEIEVLQRLLDVVATQKKPVRFIEWKANEIEIIAPLLLLTAKPVVYLVNMCEEDFKRKKNKWLVKIKQWIDSHSAPFSEPLIPFCGTLEAAGVAAAKKEVGADDTLQAAGMLAKIIKTGYTTLDLIYFFTCGADEVRCWTIRRGTKAPGAAGTIHTDFEKGFVCAEVMAYNDLHELGTETAVKEAGKHRQQGKTYEVQDGDICFFRANTSGLKKK